MACPRNLFAGGLLTLLSLVKDGCCDLQSLQLLETNFSNIPRDLISVNEFDQKSLPRIRRVNSKLPEERKFARYGAAKATPA